MELIILGSGTAIPTKDRNCAGYLIQHNDKLVIMDSGSGTRQQLAKAGFDARAIASKLGLMVYSHLHPDHVADCIPLLQAIHVQSSNIKDPERTEPIMLYGPMGFKKYYESYRANSGFWKESYPVEVREGSEDAFDFGSMKITSKPVKHASDLVCLGYRIEADGKVIAYSGDTEYCESLVELARNADILIADCTAPEGKAWQAHMDSVTCGRVAREANVKKLILSHMYPMCEDADVVSEAKKDFGGEVIRAEDLMRIKA